MEVNREHLNESKSIQSLLQQGVSHHHLHLAENLRHAGIFKRIIVEKRKVFKRSHVTGNLEADSLETGPLMIGNHLPHRLWLGFLK